MNDAGQRLTFPDVVKTAIRSLLSDELHTCLPGKITKIIDYKKKKVSVKPLVKRSYVDGTILELPIIDNVPVVYPEIGEALLKFPLIVGTKVLLVFAERSLDNWLSSGNDSLPGHAIKFSITDAIAIIGLNDFSSANDLITDNTSFEMIYKGAKITIKDDGTMILDNGDCTIEMNSSQVKINGNNLTVDNG